MAHLTLVGLSEDGLRLLLVSDKGVEFTLDIDLRLRTALREHGGDRRLEIQMESSLRPRDIQARIRAGESPETVAQSAQTSVDRIMTYAAPVLAERQHVADRAQRSSVRRRGGESGSSGGARTLGDVVAVHLRSLNVDPTSVEWDAWRREDGRWSLTGDFTTGTRSGSASFAYDSPGNFVVAENDDARWLLGEQVGKGEARSSRDDLSSARERRLNAAPQGELPLGEDAIELVHAPDESAGLGAEQPLEAYLDDEPPTREHPAVGDEPADVSADVEPVDPEPAAESEPVVEDEQPTRRAAKKKARASVPSWDEIMFGGGKSD